LLCDISTDRQTPAANAIAIYDQDAPRNVLVTQPRNDIVHALDCFSLAPIAPAKQDQARSGRAGTGKKARIIEISGNDRAPFGIARSMISLSGLRSMPRSQA
jgi:hypothetical protein